MMSFTEDRRHLKEVLVYSALPGHTLSMGVQHLTAV